MAIVMTVDWLTQVKCGYGNGPLACCTLSQILIRISEGSGPDEEIRIPGQENEADGIELHHWTKSGWMSEWVVTWHVYKGRRFNLLDLYDTNPQLLQHPNKSIAVSTRRSSTLCIVQTL